LGENRAMFFENLVSRFRPDERFRIGMMRIDEFTGRRLQLGHTAMGAAPQLFVCS
jgi:hypothetical protein